MTTYQQDSTNLMRRAIQAGIVDPMPESMRAWAQGTPNLYRVLCRQVKGQFERTAQRSPWLGLQNTWQRPETRRYQVSESPIDAPISMTPTAIDRMVELARFRVPSGYVGIIKSIEQYQAKVALAGTTVYTTAPVWGDPWGYSPALTWYFRLSTIGNAAPAWINRSGAAADQQYLPGSVYSDLPSITGLWYQAASSAAANVHLAVPGGFILRAFCSASAAVSDALQVSLRLTGSIQSEVCPEAQEVARVTW